MNLPRITDHLQRGKVGKCIIWLRTALFIGTLVVTGCQYGDVSPLTYEYSKALYSITNRRDTDRLDQIRAQVSQSLEEEALSPEEATWLGQIINDAAAGHWERANQSARQIMEDQVKTS